MGYLQNVNCPKLFYKFNMTAIKILMESFMEIYKGILKFMWRTKRTEIKQDTSGNKNKWRYLINNMKQS